MRKKIFVIHGAGEKEGLGKESGGDLDTVGSNAFYGAWFKNHFQEEEGREPVYGEDFEFDFVNYSEGIRHLDIHEGCDVYLPDFPIDALPPRLELRRMKREDEAEVRRRLYEEKENLRKLFYQNSEVFPDHWKAAFNDLNKQMDKINSDRQFFEIWSTVHYAGILAGAAEQIVGDGGEEEVMELLGQKMFGEDFEAAARELEEVLDSTMKRDLLDELPQDKVHERLLLNDAAGYDFACKGRLGWHEQFLGVLVEGISVYVSTALLTRNINDELDEAGLQDLLDWLKVLRSTMLGPVSEFYELVDKIQQANPENPNVKKIHSHMKALHELWEGLSYDWMLEQHQPLEDRLIVQLSESASGRPVSDIELVVNVTEGEVTLSRPEEAGDEFNSLALPTAEDGTVEVKLNHDGISPDEFGIAVTHNDLDFLTFPENLKLSENYFDEHPSPDSAEFRLVEYVKGSSGEVTSDASANKEKIESGEGLREERAIEINCDLIEEHVRYLAEKDVRLIRIDDHHPYEPAVLERLQGLKEEGLIVEDIVLSSLPQGEEMPIEEQKCGADLIYEQFVEGTAADNSGLSRLRAEAHVQDLHIRESELAIEISKLIGSSYNKIEMVQALMNVENELEMKEIMSRQGWDEVVAEYEAGLEKVLPRVEKTLFHIHLVEPPEDGDYAEHVGMRKFLHPLELMTAGEKGKEQLYKELYASGPGQDVNIYSALSPFCNQKLGEPTINVASALNYLTKRYSIDYYFYAYGSFLFSTRRVNEEGFIIDLSNLVSKVGSPADGGHAAAATGSPENNPSFPKERFDNVSDRNFAEYLYYILETVCDVTGLELVELREQYPDELEENMEDVLKRLDRNVYNMQLAGDDGTVSICFTDSVWSEQDEPDLSFPLALAHLRRKYPMDYFFYSISPGNLLMRNVMDQEEILNLNDAARALGTHRDGGHPRAASCQPKFNPKFDAKSFKYVNYKNIDNYVKFIAKRLTEELGFNQYQVKAY